MLAANKKSFENMMKMVESGTKKNYSDDRFWKPTIDKDGDGCAIIRFLDNSHIDGDSSTPVRKYYMHSFKNPNTNQWYIEKSLTTFDLPDPVYEYNGLLYNSGSDENKEIAKSQRRKLEYVCNILVVEDMGNPANNGKVFLYKFGKTIWDKIAGKLHPKFAAQKSVNPFDLHTGCNLTLIIKQPPNSPRDRDYGLSEWQDVAPVGESDEAINKIKKQMYSLNEFSDPSKFKSYDELKARLDKVVGVGGVAGVLNAKAMDSVPSANPPSVGNSAQSKFSANEVDEALGTGKDSVDADISEFADLLKDEEDLPF